MKLYRLSRGLAHRSGSINFLPIWSQIADLSPSVQKTGLTSLTQPLAFLDSR